MAVTAWKRCGTAISWNHDGSAGGVWTNPGNVTADDNTDAVTYDFAFPPGGTADLLKCTNFGFTSGDLPDGVTIDAIEIRIGDAWRNSGSDAIVDAHLQLVDESGALVGSNQSNGSRLSLTGSRANYDIGSTLGVWGWATVTAAKLRDSDMGVAILLNGTSFDFFTALTGAIDYVDMRVHYTAAASQTLIGTGFSDGDSFGAGTVTPGNLTLVGTGLSDADAFGAGTVVVGNVTLVGAGMASGNAFGAGAVVQPSTSTRRRYAASTL